MRRFLTSSAALLAALAFSTPALASGLSESAEPPPEGEDEEDELELEDDEMDAETPAAGGEEGEVGAKFDTSFLDDGDDKKKKKKGSDKDIADSAGGDGEGLTADEQRKIDERMITVIQRQAFLNVYTNEEGGKVRRFEIQPQIGLSVNDPYVRHYSAGGEANLWLTNRMAIGLNAHGFLGDRTPAYERIRFQEGLLLTANKYLWQASLGYLYEPFYGKIAIFNRMLMHWEAYTQIGGGVIHSRVIPRFESLHDPFDNILPQGNFAIGSRFYLGKADFVSFNFAVRTWVWLDYYEPLQRGPATGGTGQIIDDPKLNSADAAKEASRAAKGELAFNSMAYFGISLYLPPKFRYSTRR